MKVVVNTNVIVSGLCSPFGAPGEIVRMAASGMLELCYDARIISEYRKVLLRPKFCFDRARVYALLDQIKTCGHLVAATPLPKGLPDTYDEPFLEVALAGKAQYLVTGNLRHYPARRRRGVSVVSPRRFIHLIR